MNIVVGVDGTRDGWVAVRMTDGIVSGSMVYPRIGELLAGETSASIVAIDMPIGLPLVTAWPRAADIAARAMLGPLKSSVFLVSTVEALSAATYPAAVSVCREAKISCLSQQALCAVPQNL